MRTKRRSEMTPDELERARARDRRRAVTRSPQRKEHYAANREAILVGLKQLRDGPDGDALRARDRAAYARNREKRAAQSRAWQAKNKPKVKAWKLANRHRSREYTRRRKALEFQTATERVDYQRIWRESDGTCGICATPILVYDEIHFDHIVPLSRGGTHTKENIQVSHARCNLTKHAKVEAA